MSRRNHSSKEKHGAAPARATEAPSAPEEGLSRQRCSIKATLLEDAHLGSGTGGAGVNALLARDRRGHPVIWASHLEGLLRAASVTVYGEDQTNRTFGAAGGSPQSMVFTSLYCEQKVPPGTSRIWRSTARASYDNRAPAEDSLRAIEYVPKETGFEGMVDLPASELGTLERLLKEVGSIGHGRATGAGRVEFTFEPDPGKRRPVTISAEATSVRLLLRNLDPLCVAATATPGNIIPTEPYVPGRTLLGALANWLLGAKEAAAARLLVSEAILVSDALPLPAHERPDPESLATLEVVPAPLSLQSTKPTGTQSQLPWWTEEASSTKRIDAARDKWHDEGTKDAAETGPPKPKLKRPEPDLFLARRSGGPWLAYRPDIRVRLRNGRPDPRKDAPDLFAIEQIAEHTLFLAELHGSPAELQRLLEALRPVLEGRRWLRVGRAGAPVEVRRVESTAPRPGTLTEGYLTLTSDLLVRDDLLRWRTSLAHADFATIPGWPVEPNAEAIQVTRCHQEQATVHGFNGTARLWRLPAAGVRRGSVFRVSGPGVASLLTAAAQGRWLGERTHEGFGRFRLDPELPGVGATDEDCEDASHVDDSRGDSSDEAACEATKKWPRDALATPERGTERCPSLSQWHDLVSELSSPDPGVLKQAISRRKKPDTAGAASWSHQQAQEVLTKLEKLQDTDRRTYAHMFVRWLRVAMKSQKQETA